MLPKVHRQLGVMTVQDCVRFLRGFDQRALITLQIRVKDCKCARVFSIHAGRIARTSLLGITICNEASGES
jgi:hypothetical protein